MNWLKAQNWQKMPQLNLGCIVQYQLSAVGMLLSYHACNTAMLSDAEFSTEKR
jgi:hypothetical protein